MSSWERIDDVLTPGGAEKLQVGQVLVFDYEGSRVEYKVMRKQRGRVWVKRIRLYTPEELEQHLRRKS